MTQASVYQNTRFAAARTSARSGLTRIKTFVPTAPTARFDGTVFPSKGFYVGGRVPSSDPRIAPHFELLGYVESTKGSQLNLTDCRGDIETVEASKAFPEKCVFASCLSHVFGERATEVAEALERERATLRRGPRRRDHITKAVEFLGRKQHEMIPGIPFTFGPLLDSPRGLFRVRNLHHGQSMFLTRPVRRLAGQEQSIFCQQNEFSHSLDSSSGIRD